MSADLTSDVASHLARVQLINHCTGLTNEMERLFDCVKENSAELLHIMLLKAHCRLPSKTLCEAFCIHVAPSRQLEVCEKLLQLIGDTVLLTPVEIFYVLPGIDKPAELRCHIETLQKTVHVASCTLISETDILALPILCNERFQNISLRICLFREVLASSWRTLVQNKCH